MVKQTTALGRSGLQDWLLQRCSAIYLALYIVFLMVRLFVTSPMSYPAWHDLFHAPWMKGITFIALLSLIVHAWIGIWTITIDYLKPVSLRLFVQIVVILALVWYLSWGIFLVWKV